ncbi:hypothetical protein [Roseococcus pinisoli]|uniref:Uncharacterized protein n=1 Tax=Roseococcus pinisoli TaxID=2835040 RepID=A0ABS5QBN8_9PROT|nr:hypothetical protein [Roseococcus pinisoli]MBS7811101.1 hypothetical protein [Roseococcus pinisoli]
MAQILPFPQTPEERLRAALRGLDMALAAQKEAFADFRANLSALGGAVSGLKASLHDYRGALDDTARDLRAAQSSARRLEATAERWVESAY